MAFCLYKSEFTIAGVAVYYITVIAVTQICLQIMQTQFHIESEDNAKRANMQISMSETRTKPAQKRTPPLKIERRSLFIQRSAFLTLPRCRARHLKRSLFLLVS